MLAAAGHDGEERKKQPKCPMRVMEVDGLMEEEGNCGSMKRRTKTQDWERKKAWSVGVGRHLEVLEGTNLGGGRSQTGSQRKLHPGRGGADRALGAGGGGKREADH